VFLRGKGKYKGKGATRLVCPGKCGLIAIYKSQLSRWKFCICTASVSIVTQKLCVKHKNRTRSADGKKDMDVEGGTLNCNSAQEYAIKFG